MDKRAVILAGGKGTRLKPYTISLPKPLVPIGENPILEIIIKILVKHNFTHITIAINHQADIIRAFFGTGEKWDVKIDYSLEDKPLSTMGPLRLIPDLPEDFLVMNGDVLTDLNFMDFYENHIKEKNIFTISAYQQIEFVDFGVLNMDSTETLMSFIEKPRIPYNVSMGIYMVNKKILQFIPYDQPYGFDNLMYDLIKTKNHPKVKVFNGYWLDIGRPDDYEQSINDYELLKNKFGW